MLQGAIIGAIAGLVVALLTLWMRSKRAQRFLAAVDSGRLEDARAQVDRWAAPATKLPLTKILDQSERMAALIVLRDTSTLAAEIAGHTGNISAVGQIDAIGWVGLALLGPDPEGATARLLELADRVEREGGRSLTIVKRKVALLAQLAQALVSGQLPDNATTQSLDKLAGAQLKLTKLVVLQALGETYERAGRPDGARNFKDRVRNETRAFEL